MEKSFRYEMHLHDLTCSRCGISSGEEFVKTAKEKGFSGFVITNHFYHGNSAIDRALSWRDFVGAYWHDYEETKKIATEYDLDVFFGLEEAYGSGQHLLIYGLSFEVVASKTEFPNMSLPEIYAFVHENNGFLVFAHPYRDLADANLENYPDLRYADAVEVYNAGNKPESNQLAEEFVKKTGVRTIAGSDTHSVKSFGRGGLVFSRRLYTPENLVEDLFANRYRLIIDGQENG